MINWFELIGILTCVAWLMIALCGLAYWLVELDFKRQKDEKVPKYTIEIKEIYIDDH